MHEERETFLTLLRDPAHWQFELFLIFLFDGVVGFMLWPCARKWLKLHKKEELRLEELEARLHELEKQGKEVVV